MNIDFAPPSKGTYNNAGSCRRLLSYLEHEDLERMEQGIYTEGFFNLTEDNVFKSQVIKDIDGNIGQLLKTDAKFYAVHVSPSEKELQAMGNTEQEQAESMKRYIREIFIPEYAKNFNKGLSTEDIKFYGKIHFNRTRSDNNLNMHCHLIVSRKDQSNKVKISPLTNHKNTQKGIVKGGFDRTALFEKAEKGFDKLFGYNRQLSESFEYYNAMKNGSIADQLNMQEKQIADDGKNTDMSIQTYDSKSADQYVNISANKQENNDLDKQRMNDLKQSINNEINPSIDKSINKSIDPAISNDAKSYLPPMKKKKRKPRL
ncbi:MAG: DUF5712 family protein [Breznakibacter sp.]